ncbi:MAG: RNA 2',3'-cyclic phosphodiesterase [Candidatus Moranbacteria bacterium]|nr:RNA 2',3'-cyclic phosphodiesterase [Candidatus Moranbacteria bacterium]
MQKKKIFVEIDVPGNMRRRLAQKIADWSELPIKWMKEENFHITVAFVGYVDESMLPEICQKVRTAVEDFEAFDLEFDRIELGPNPEDPKMVWLTGQPCVELGMLNEEVERALGMRPAAHKEFSPHITLGRIRKLKWDELEIKPAISEKTIISMTVDSLSIMESKGGGAEYVSLEECPLA